MEVREDVAWTAICIAHDAAFPELSVAADGLMASVRMVARDKQAQLDICRAYATGGLQAVHVLIERLRFGR